MEDKKGGILLSILFTYSKYGDPNKAALVKSGLAKVSQISLSEKKPKYF